MSVSEIGTELMERVARACEEIDDARRLAPNSYGHGYAAGLLDAYTQILDLLDEDTP